MTGPYRLPASAPRRFGARIDRSEPVGFRLGSAVHNGFYGDTLASALLAAGVSTFGASRRLGRPRGPMALGLDDPSMLLVEDAGAWRAVPAGEVVLREGLRARAFASAAETLRRLAPPTDRETRSLPIARVALERIRRVLPMPAPRLPKAAPPVAVRHERCDALVIGAGLAGLCAASALASAGLDVRIVEAAAHAGGIADLYEGRIDGAPLGEWTARRAADFAGTGALSLNAKAVAIDAGGVVSVVEGGGRGGDAPALRLIAAGAIVVATGFRERPMAFFGNDRPGVMSATAARALLRRHAVAPGARVLVATSGDEGYRTAMDLREAGVAVDFVIDQRDAPDGPTVEMAKALGAPVSLSSVVTGVEFDRKLGAISGVRVRNRFGEGASAAARVLSADALVVFGGFAPRDELARASSLTQDQGLHLALRGPNAAEAAAGGWAAGEAAAAQLGATVEGSAPAVEAVSDEMGEAPTFSPASFEAVGASETFGDIGAEITLADLARAFDRRGAAPAAIRRRLGLGSGVDAGRLSADLPALALGALGAPADEVAGPTPDRPTLALLAARVGTD